jgi:glycosyltransferase involved in cell wall biosynthesis
MTKKLSILTCTLHNRINFFKRIDTSLKKQTKFLTNIELLANCDNGEKTIGEKRNELLNASKGEYVVFVDDDDYVSDDYVIKILKAISTSKKPDCCGIEGIIYDPLGKNKFVHSLRYDKWFDENGVYYRSPNHINPIKRELALEVGFEKVSYGEDFEFSKKIKPLLKSEIYIDSILYHYFPSSNFIKK